MLEERKYITSHHCSVDKRLNIQCQELIRTINNLILGVYLERHIKKLNAWKKEPCRRTFWHLYHNVIKNKPTIQLFILPWQRIYHLFRFGFGFVSKQLLKVARGRATNCSELTCCNWMGPLLQKILQHIIAIRIFIAKALHLYRLSHT